MVTRAKTDLIVVHHSASKWGDVDAIRKWHTDPKPNGNGWSDIGYTWLILNGRARYGDEYDEARDGEVQAGRREDLQGAHCSAVNARSIGVCCVGMGEPTEKQLAALALLVADIKTRYPGVVDVAGHRDFSATGCPGWDVRTWYKSVFSVK